MYLVITIIAYLTLKIQILPKNFKVVNIKKLNLRHKALHTKQISPRFKNAKDGLLSPPSGNYMLDMAFER